MSAQGWWWWEDALVLALALTCTAWAAQEWRSRRMARTVLAGLATLVSMIMLLGGFRVGVASGMSMAPSLSQWNITLVSLPWWGQSSLPHPGHVVVFSVTDPDTGLPQTLAKRVVAVEGQRLQYRAGQLKVNGQELTQAWEGQTASKPAGTVWKHVQLGRVPVAVWAPLSGMPDISVDRQLSKDQVFVLGDHWANSWDSRNFGPIPAGAIRGRVVAAWSWEKGWKGL